jgi:hypothetical protein
MLSENASFDSKECPAESLTHPSKEIALKGKQRRLLASVTSAIALYNVTAIGFVLVRQNNCYEDSMIDDSFLTIYDDVTSSYTNWFSGDDDMYSSNNSFDNTNQETSNKSASQSSIEKDIVP